MKLLDRLNYIGLPISDMTKYKQITSTGNTGRIKVSFHSRHRDLLDIFNPTLFIFQISLIIYIIFILGKPLEANAKDIIRKGREYNVLGMQSLVDHNFSLAEKYFTLALKFDPGNKYYYNNLSVVYMNQGRYSLSKKYLKKAIIIDPHYYKALSNMAISCFHLFDFRLAYHYYLRSMNANRIYTIKRFDRDRVMKRIEEIHRDHPDKGELKLLLEYLENHKNKLPAD